MRKYTQITVVISVLIFLVWLRSAKFGVDEAYTTGIKENNSIGSGSEIITPAPSTPTLTPSPTILKQNNTAKNITIVPTAPPPTSTPTPAQTGQYKNGTYTGSVADAFYGNIQVQAVISGGQIIDVIFLQYPNDNNTSRNINSQAMPLLKQEAIQAQSANVSGVSGASATSPAFQQSLASALSQAK